MTPDRNERFAVRRRGDGWAVVDLNGGGKEVRFGSQVDAERYANSASKRAERVERTYSVTGYCEVDAADETEAIAKARKFLALRYREDWEPVDVAAVSSVDAEAPQP